MTIGQDRRRQGERETKEIKQSKQKFIHSSFDGRAAAAATPASDLGFPHFVRRKRPEGVFRYMHSLHKCSCR